MATARAPRFYDALLARIASTSGVESAGVITMMPFGGLDGHTGFLIERRTTEFPFPVRVRPLSVSASYFEMLRIPRGAAATSTIVTARVRPR